MSGIGPLSIYISQFGQYEMMGCINKNLTSSGQRI